jgi:hypothetical protein
MGDFMKTKSSDADGRDLKRQMREQSLLLLRAGGWDTMIKVKVVQVET